jgi:FtsP/CotA-like multicopper oxidase with cupredoxin domain
MLTRRQFAVGGAAMISVGTLDRSRAGGAPLRADPPLPIPALIDAGKASRSVKLRIASARHAFLEGRPATTYGYSAPVLGPVVRVRRGDEVEMAVENALDRDTTVHWHGLQVPGDVDGGPH